MTVKIAPSILSADFANLGAEVIKICQAGADMIHIDVMDGHFVPNLTIGPSVIKAIKPYSTIPFDVHLMIENPEDHIESYIEAGADILTFHFEATKHVGRLVHRIKNLGAKVGISLLPTTNASSLKYILNELDLILVMSVNPGFGGQQFIPSQLSKISRIRKKIDAAGLPIILAVDGGINDSNASDVVSAGANMLIAGSYIFNGDEIAININNLRK